MMVVSTGRSSGSLMASLPVDVRFALSWAGIVCISVFCWVVGSKPSSCSCLGKNFSSSNKDYEDRFDFVDTIFLWIDRFDAAVRCGSFIQSVVLLWRVVT